MSNKKILALFGKSGAGKDTILKYISSNYDINKIIRLTTRPKRAGETDGVEYVFKDPLVVTEDILNTNKDFLEIGVFNEWIYATPAEHVKEGWNIATCDVDAVRQMIYNDCDIEVFPMYVEVSDKTRLLRALNREENPNVKEIVRRFQSDEYDYEYIDFEYISFDNENAFNPEDLLEILLKNNIDLKK